MGKGESLIKKQKTIKHKNDQGNSIIRYQKKQDPQSLHQMWQNLLSQRQEGLLKLWIPCCQDQKIRRLVQKASQKERSRYWQNEKLEERPQKSQEWLQSWHHPQAQDHQEYQEVRE